MKALAFLNPWIPFLSFFLGLFLLVAYSLPVLFLSGKARTDFWPSPIPKTKLAMMAVYALGALLVLQVLSRLALPLQWEDHRHFSGVATEPWIYINPFTRTEHHSITNFLSFLSAEVFGYSKGAIKFPAVVFSILFVVQLVAFGKKWLSVTGILFILIHLNVNEFSLWFMHSMRGYILSMLITSGMLFQSWKVLNEEKSSPSLLLFLGLGFLCVFSHLFSTLFSVFIFFTLLTWFLWFRSNLSSIQLKNIKRLVKIYLWVLLPFYSGVLLLQGHYLLQLGDLFKAGFPNLARSVALMLGFSFDWNTRLLVVTFFVAASYFFRNRSRLVSDFFTYNITLCFVSAVFLFLSIYALKVRLVESRFLLVFLVPFLMAAGESLSKLKGHSKLLFGAGLTLSLIVVPFLSRNGIQQTQVLATQSYEKFILSVQSYLQDKPGACLTYQGEPNLVYFSQSIYLRDKPVRGCKDTFHIYFESPKDLPPTDTRPAESAGLGYEKLFDVEGRYAFFRQRE